VVLVDEPAQVDHQRTRLAAELCSELECDGATASQVQAAIKQLPAPERPDKISRQMTNQALADSFRRPEFDAIILDEYWSIIRPREIALEAGRVQVLLQLHPALDEKQRAHVAEMIRERGLRFLRLGDGRDRSRARGGRPERWAARICSTADCTPSQLSKVQFALEGIESRRLRSALREQRALLAEAFASSTLDRESLETYATVTEETRAERRQATDDAIVIIHRVLDAGQRAALADELDLEGMAAFGAREPSS
jgi:hypothetical protein